MAVVAKTNFLLRSWDHSCGDSPRFSRGSLLIFHISGEEPTIRCKCNYYLKLSRMIRFSTTISSLCLLALFMGCQTDRSSTSEAAIQSTEYAKGFSVKRIGSSTEITITKPYPNDTTPIKYLLVTKNETIPEFNSDTQIIRTPVDKIVCTSTSHIALLDHLNSLDKLVGFPTTDLISSASARARIDSGLFVDLGIDNEMNLEALVSLQPNMVMGYSMGAVMLNLNKIREFGIPVGPNELSMLVGIFSE